MNFSIATIQFWNSVGFDTEYWRTSNDGLKAMCHSKYAETLVNLDNENILTLDRDSQAFQDLMREEFTVHEDEEE